MQTFLPYPNLQASAQALDTRRLGKQRIEAWTILQVLLGKSKSNAWRNHPAVLMWYNHEQVLTMYGIAICEEWKNRGKSDTYLTRFYKLNQELPPTCFPKWFGSEEFHASHRSALMQKNPNYYSVFCWKDSLFLSLVWPCNSGVTNGLQPSKEV